MAAFTGALPTRVAGGSVGPRPEARDGDATLFRVRCGPHYKKPVGVVIDYCKCGLLVSTRNDLLKHMMTLLPPSILPPQERKQGALGHGLRRPRVSPRTPRGPPARAQCDDRNIGAPNAVS